MKKLTYKTVLVTPEMAEKMLEKNTMNRPLSSSAVERYALAMKAGQWVLNGESIIIAQDGTILDGQHRLWAIFESQTPVELSIAYNVSKDYFATINSGKARNGVDVLSIKGIKNASIAAPIVRLVYIYDMQDCSMRLSGKNVGITNRVIEKYAEQILDELLPAVEIASTGRHHFVQSVMGFCFIIFARKNRGKAEEFMHMLKTGENLECGNPVLALQKKLLDFRISRTTAKPREMIALYFKAWNAFVKGKNLYRLNWNAATDEFPGVK